MVDVGAKSKTARVAVAKGRVRMSNAALQAIRDRTVEKGDVLACARVAAIMGAKRTPELVPLCHPIGLAGVEVDLSVGSVGVDIKVTVKTVERTGVEMEALTAVAAAALTVYDMLKSSDRGMIIESVQLEHKSGGRSGVWTRSDVGLAKLKAKRKS
jgi:cyclic pyranopterin phosphate synthase